MSSGCWASRASMSSRRRKRSASLKRCATLEESFAPNPSRRSDTKKMRFRPGAGRSPGALGARKTTPSFHQSSEAIASWLK